MSTVCDLLHTEPVIDKTKVHRTLESLNMSLRKRKPKLSQNFSDNQSCNEINSTCSFLSDLSMTQLEDDFGFVDLKKPFKKLRPSITSQNTSITRKFVRQSSVPVASTHHVETDLPDLDFYNNLRGTSKAEQHAKHVEAEGDQCDGSVSTIKISSNCKENSPQSQEKTKNLKLQNDLNLLNFPMRQHNFSPRTVLRLESCAYCNKK